MWVFHYTHDQEVEYALTKEKIKDLFNRNFPFQGLALCSLPVMLSNTRVSEGI